MEIKANFHQTLRKISSNSHFWFFNFLSDCRDRWPTVIAPKPIVKCQSDVSKVKFGSFKAVLQVAGVSNRDLVDSAENDDQACNDFAGAENVVDFYVKFNAHEVDVRN